MTVNSGGQYIIDPETGQPVPAGEPPRALSRAERRALRQAATMPAPGAVVRIEEKARRSGKSLAQKMANVLTAESPAGDDATAPEVPPPAEATKTTKRSRASEE